MRHDSVASMHYHNVLRASPFRTPYKVTYINPAEHTMWVKIYWVLSEENLQEVIEACKLQIFRRLKMIEEDKDKFIAAYAPLGVLEIQRVTRNNQVYGNQEHKMWQSGHGTHKHDGLAPSYISCGKCTDL